MKRARQNDGGMGPAIVGCLVILAVAPARAQAPPVTPTPEEEVAEEVSVAPRAADDEIAERLTSIMQATEWYTDPEALVEEGVVFLSGKADTEEHREWAARLARNTQDVVAVVNRLEVEATSPWDLTPAWQTLRELLADTVRRLPLLLLGVALLVVAWLLARWTRRGAASVLRRKIRSQLLRDVVSRALAVPVFVLGLYVILKLSGLAGLAMTVIGGTGLLGLVIGFAFRDIAENFLASVLLSMQRPFATGDLIEVAGFKGFVQSVNTRATLMMTLEGNHVQIPNATIYKEPITNFTANPLERFDFGVGIGYADSITGAQSVALQVIREHSAVVPDPEPLVLVESLGAATVNLRIYFWANIMEHSGLKVRSAVMRLTKIAFDQAGISMPDEAREVVFPSGVAVHMVDRDEVEAGRREVLPSPAAAPPEDAQAAHRAEGGLASEAGEIQQQARNARVPEEGPNLLES